ncbi:MAG: hypothetical protein K2X06_16985 [Burkholderiales bacterium]|nr:hypothetical protein [Burkholderiales bacterium]
MSNVNIVFEKAELSLASYAVLAGGIPTNTAAQKEALIAQGFTVQHADEFSIRYPTIATQFNDTAAEGGMGTSFSATVFKDASGNLTLAIRGTLELAGIPSDLIPTDANVLVNGAGYDQIVAMYNWWKREASEGGLLVEQYQLLSRLREEAQPLNSVFLTADPLQAFYLERLTK